MMTKVNVEIKTKNRLTFVSLNISLATMKVSDFVSKVVWFNSVQVETAFSGSGNSCMKHFNKGGYMYDLNGIPKHLEFKSSRS